MAVLAGAVGMAVGGMGAAVLVGVAPSLVDVGGAMVGGGGVSACVGAQAATIATRIIAPIRLQNPAIFHRYASDDTGERLALRRLAGSELEDNPVHLGPVHEFSQHTDDVAGNLAVRDRQLKPDISRPWAVKSSWTDSTPAASRTWVCFGWRCRPIGWSPQ